MEQFVTVKETGHELVTLGFAIAKEIQKPKISRKDPGNGLQKGQEFGAEVLKFSVPIKRAVERKMPEEVAENWFLFFFEGQCTCLQGWQTDGCLK